MKSYYYAEYQNVIIRPLEKKDIEQLRIWRNDTKQIRFLRNIGYITREMQEKWYENYLKDPDTLTFVVEETEKIKHMVGSLSLYNFHDEEAEIGRLQIGDLSARGMGIGGKSFVLAMAIGFKKMGLKRIYASVHRENIAAYKSYLRIGFQICGYHSAPVGGVEDEIEITFFELTQANKYLSAIKINSGREIDKNNDKEYME